MSEVFTKAEFARRCGVSPAAVSNWIKRGKLTVPALLRDGRIDAALADAQLGLKLEITRRITRPVPAAPSPAEVFDLSASRDLLRAKATMAQIEAARRQREFALQTGRFILTSTAEESWSRVMGELIANIESSLPDLADQLPDRHKALIVIRKWWRTLREREAARNQQIAATLPELVEDREASF